MVSNILKLIRFALARAATNVSFRHGLILFLNWVILMLVFECNRRKGRVTPKRKHRRATPFHASLATTGVEIARGTYLEWIYFLASLMSWVALKQSTSPIRPQGGFLMRHIADKQHGIATELPKPLQKFG
ncbi:hypothetical protein FIBSPDRAFT_934502 [Athelia psychrophila]|uniref:Uncharacterized protein n=1 Tax=Athelia psychrophila TaxID=1759441 RepID=A0A166FA35_9AGAM|nr:hypothetical protein FIBSPDRAFT_934502 [Fibularhizoctonia sp. CBS 109695]